MTHLEKSFQFGHGTMLMVAMMALVIPMILLASTEYTSLIAGFTEVTRAGGSRSSRAEGSLRIPTAEDEPRI